MKRLLRNSYLTRQLGLICFLASASGLVQAAKTYTPNDVFAGVEYANQLIDKILAAKQISNVQPPLSRESSARPMHVYELHVAVLSELYQYSQKNSLLSPPAVVSSPKKYTPTDVYSLTRLIMQHVGEIYSGHGETRDFNLRHYSDKTPTDVYQELFELYYRLSRLNGKKKISPSEVYAQILRAKEDVHNSLLIISKRLPQEQEFEKRLLVTATYGMHPDGSVMSAFEDNKKPADVLKIALKIRDKLNELRGRNKLDAIKQPVIEQYQAIKPIDVFLQTQFIIAELNVLKIPMKIVSTISGVKPVSEKTPADVYHEMKQIDYMLNRLMSVI